MKIGQFIKSLVPSFKKKDIVGDLDKCATELAEINLPQVSAAAEFFKNWRFKDDRVKAFDARFSKEVVSKTRGNFIVVLATITKQLEETIELARELLRKEFSDNIITDGITYRKANIIQFVESINFFLRYQRTLMLWVYGCETKAIDGAQDEPLTKSQVAWMTDKAQAFLFTCDILARSKQDLTKTFNSISDAVHTDGNDEIITSVSGSESIDPLRFLVVGTSFNIIYHARMFLADLAANRYHAAKEEQRALSYRLINLKEISAGRNDPKLQLELQEVEGRLASLNAKIAREEAEYA